MAAGFNYLGSVPKLTGRANYDEWAFAVENMLVLEGLNKCLVDDSPDSILVAKAKAKLILTIDPSLYSHVKDAKTAKEVWINLKNLYEDSGFARKIGLLRTLISSRLENHDSMELYINQVVETSQKLRRTGFKIDEEWIGSLLLAGLPEKYAPMIMAVEHSGIKITTDSIKTKLLDMQADGSTSGAFTANVRKFKSNFKKNARDGGCVHRESKHNQNVGKQNRDMNSVICFKCKKPGHFMSKCPNEKSKGGFNAVFTTGQFKNSDWYVDSGASVHLTANQQWLKNEREAKLTEIIVANKAKIPVSCEGDVEIKTVVDNLEYDILLTNVQYVPELTTNLLSVHQLIKNGNSVSFDENSCKIFNTNNVLVATASLNNNVYKLNITDQQANFLAGNVSSEVWHCRLGHLNGSYMNKMYELVNGLTYQKHVDKQNCKICCEGKQTRLPFPNKGSRAVNILEVVHSDICGPMETKSLGGARYFAIFIDDCTRMCFIYFLKTKDEIFDKFREFKTLVEKQKNKSIKILRTDNGGEYCSKEFESFLRKNGIIHQKTNSYTPEQNGMAERFNRTLVEKAKCLMFDENVDKFLWAEACNTACYLKNRSPATGISKTPLELWTNKKPDVSHLRIYGSEVMVHIPKVNRYKWDKKATMHILVGYDEYTKGYRCYNPITKNVIISRDVIFFEKNRVTHIVSVNHEESVDPVGEEENPDPVGEDIKLDQSENHSILTEEDQTDILDDVKYDEDVPEEEPEIPVIPRRTERTVKKKSFEDFVTYLNLSDNNPDTDPLPDNNAPSNVCEVFSRHDRQQWQQAMLEEMQSFEDNETWELVDPPEQGTVVESKWVFKVKCDGGGKKLYRARLVAKGYTQKEGIDYNQTFAPVVRHSTLRFLIALAVQFDLKIIHLDVKTAFLNGALKEDVYMQQPEGFVSKGNESKVFKLKKAVYGLKQSSRAWNEKVDEVLLKIGYRKSLLEPCLYIHKSNNLFTIIALYVDDFFVFSNDPVEVNSLESYLGQNFKIKNLGEAKQCLGVRIIRDYRNNFITLDQECYIDEILKKFNMLDCNSVSSPLDCNFDFEETKNETCDIKLPFQQLIGNLMYLAVLTRPDIAYAVSFLSQFNNCYNKVHWQCAKRILRYLKGTKNVSMKFEKTDSLNLVGFVDADWGSNKRDRKSYSGYIFKLSGAAISWKSCKQKTVALSSTEAEYMALSEATKEAIYLRNLLSDLTGQQDCVEIYNDNQSTQKLANNPVFHDRSKHIDIRYHFVRDAVRDKIIDLKYLPTGEMIADILTKPLKGVKNAKFVQGLGLI